MDVKVRIVIRKSGTFLRITIIVVEGGVVAVFVVVITQKCEHGKGRSKKKKR